MHYFQLETNEKQRFVFQMKYGKHPVSTSVIYQLYGYFRHFAEHLTCNSNFRGCNRPRKLKTANIYPHILRQKRENLATRKYSILRYILFNNIYFRLNTHFNCYVNGNQNIDTSINGEING